MVIVDVFAAHPVRKGGRLKPTRTARANCSPSDAPSPGRAVVSGLESGRGVATHDERQQSSGPWWPRTTCRWRQPVTHTPPCRAGRDSALFSRRRRPVSRHPPVSWRRTHARPPPVATPRCASVCHGPTTLGPYRHRDSGGVRNDPPRRLVRRGRLRSKPTDRFPCRTTIGSSGSHRLPRPRRYRKGIPGRARARFWVKFRRFRPACPPAAPGGGGRCHPPVSRRSRRRRRMR